MDQNGCSGFGNWASYYTFNPSLSSSSSSCSPFSDQFVVPTLSSSGGAHHQQLLHQSHHHLTCLKLGKRQYCASAGTDQEVAFHGGSVKRERSSASLAVISRCQVDGCDRNLMGAKDYHRRHKVCDLHSKAPKVVILGSEQRFCQQCSRFHSVSEFDDLKRSCRRRLAGHNERRRKSANSTAPSDESRTAMGSGILHMSQTSPGRALSLLSSCSPWISTPDLSSRSSAALHELIAENRAALFSRCLLYNQAWQNVGSQNDQAQLISVAAHQNHENSAIHGQELTAQSIIAHGNWNQLQVSGGGNHLTLDLMQSPGSASFDFISRRNKSKEAEECCEIWNSLEGTHVV